MYLIDEVAKDYPPSNNTSLALDQKDLKTSQRHGEEDGMVKLLDDEITKLSVTPTDSERVTEVKFGINAFRELIIFPIYCRPVYSNQMKRLYSCLFVSGLVLFNLGTTYYAVNAQLVMELIYGLRLFYFFRNQQKSLKTSVPKS